MLAVIVKLTYARCNNPYTFCHFDFATVGHCGLAPPVMKSHELSGVGLPLLWWNHMSSLELACPSCDEITWALWSWLAPSVMKSHELSGVGLVLSVCPLFCHLLCSFSTPKVDQSIWDLPSQHLVDLLWTVVCCLFHVHIAVSQLTGSFQVTISKPRTFVKLFSHDISHSFDTVTLVKASIRVSVLVLLY